MSEKKLRRKISKLVAKAMRKGLRRDEAMTALADVYALTARLPLLCGD